jgi:hypothetical protein
MTDTVTTTEVAVEKAPSKKSQADSIFNAMLGEHQQGLYGSNKAFRAAVLGAIQTQLGVSVASAATMFNSSKKFAENAGMVTLGRDPRKVRPASTGRRGRPVGSRNKPKTEVVAPVATTETAEVASSETITA